MRHPRPGAPPADFLQEVFFPLLRGGMGLPVEMSVPQVGFYPRGGGVITATITPMASLPAGAMKPLLLLKRGTLVSRCARACVASLPTHVADRECAAVRAALGFVGRECETRTVTAANPGNYVTVSVSFEHVTEMTTGIGERGVKAEDVAGAAAAEMKAYLEGPGEAPVGEHLADQLLLPLVLGSGGTYRATIASQHSLTNVDVIRAFLGRDCIDYSTEADGSWLVNVVGLRLGGGGGGGGGGGSGSGAAAAGGATGGAAASGAASAVSGAGTA